MAVSYGFDRTRPRTKVELDSTNLSSYNVTSEKPVVMIGSAEGGEPQVPHSITNFSQAKEIFRGGELLDAIEMAWSPSNASPSAGRIIAIRANDATASSVEEKGLTIRSKLFGEDANKIQVAFEDDKKTDSKRLSVDFSKDRYHRTYSNIGNMFTVKYEGEESKAAIEITHDKKGYADTLNVKEATGSEDSLETTKSFDLGEGIYNRVSSLVNAINNLPDFKAEMNSFGSNKNIKTERLDEVKDQDIKDKEYTVKAIAGDLLNTVRNDKYITIEITDSENMPQEIAPTKLSGGHSEDVKTSWTHIFEEISDLGAYYVVPVTDDETVHQELSQFLNDESEAGNHMRAIVGGGVNESVEELRSRQTNLKSERVTLVGNSGERKMADGRVEAIPAYMVAATVAGIASGQEIGEPITYNHVGLTSLGRRFSGSQLDQLNDAGVVMIEFVRTRSNSYFRLVSDPTTFREVDQPVRSKMALGEISDFLTTELRTVLDEEFIGTKLTNTSASIIKNRVESFLDNQKGEDGLIVDYNSADVQVVVTGDTAKVNLAVQPARGLDYINVSITYDEPEMEA